MTSRTVLELFVQQDDELTDTAIMNCSPGEELCGCAEAVLATCCRVLQTPQKHATLGYTARIGQCDSFFRRLANKIQ